MWTRAQIKDRARRSFKRFYWNAVLVAFVLTLVTGGVSQFFSNHFSNKITIQLPNASMESQEHFGGNSIEDFSDRDMVTDMDGSSVITDIYGNTYDYDTMYDSLIELWEHFWDTYGVLVLVLLLAAIILSSLYQIFQSNKGDW